jgi:hypothetical protein
VAQYVSSASELAAGSSQPIKRPAVLETLRAFLWPSGCPPGSFAARATPAAGSAMTADADSGSQNVASIRIRLRANESARQATMAVANQAADQLRPWAFEEGF